MAWEFLLFKYRFFWWYIYLNIDLFCLVLYQIYADKVLHPFTVPENVKKLII